MIAAFTEHLLCTCSAFFKVAINCPHLTGGTNEPPHLSAHTAQEDHRGSAPDAIPRMGRDKNIPGNNPPRLSHPANNRLII